MKKNTKSWTNDCPLFSVKKLAFGAVSFSQLLPALELIINYPHHLPFSEFLVG
jgi:hypothetical protein